MERAARAEQVLDLNGAGRGGRTLTGLRPKVFESRSPDLLRVAPHQIQVLS